MIQLMIKAVWNNVEIAASDDTVIVEGNHYFPIAEVDQDYLQPSDMTTHCPWKGDASYYHLSVTGKRNENAAWYYPEPKAAAENIRGRIAFWRGVDVG